MDWAELTIAAGGQKARDSLARLAAPLAGPPHMAESAQQARLILRQTSAGILIVNGPLPDEFGADLAVEAAEKGGWAVVFLAQYGCWQAAANRLAPYGVLTLSKPLDPALFRQALCLALASRRRLAALEQENLRLQSKLDEIRLVNRAKSVLTQVLGLSEAQAHRAIEKQAMDLRLTRRAVAEDILKTYEL